MVTVASVALATARKLRTVLMCGPSEGDSAGAPSGSDVSDCIHVPMSRQGPCRLALPWNNPAVLHMVTISGVAASRFGWRALPPVKLRNLSYPKGSRVTMPGDALEVRRPDGSVLTGTVAVWGADAWQDA